MFNIILFFISNALFCEIQSHTYIFGSDHNRSILLKLDDSEKSKKSDEKTFTLPSGVKYIYSPNINTKKEHFGNNDIENKINNLKKEMQLMARRGAMPTPTSSFDLPKYEFLAPQQSQEAQTDFSDPIHVEVLRQDFSDKDREEIKTLVVTINSETEFDDVVLNLQETRLILVKFGAPWSAQSRLIDSKFNELSLEYKDKILFVCIDAPRFFELAYNYNATKLPVLLYFHNGQLVDRIDEGNLESLKSFILKIVS